MNELVTRVVDAQGGVDHLIDFVVERHGGIDDWYEASTVSATVRVHGGFWAFKGQSDRLGLESVTANIHLQRITMRPFGDGSSLEFDAALDRVRITGSRGEVHGPTPEHGWVHRRQAVVGDADRLLHLLRYLDVPARALPIHPPRRPHAGHRTVERGRRDLAPTRK
jgi:hypothetical protein